MIRFLVTFALSFIACMVLSAIMNASFACTVMVSVVVVILFAFMSGNNKGGR